MLREVHSIGPGEHASRRVRRALALLVVAGLVAGFLPEAASAGVTRGPIRIESDSQFTAANGVVGGVGSASDPYVIAGWNILADNRSESAIMIANTTAHVAIRDVEISGAVGTSGGIYLVNVTTASVVRASFSDLDFAIIAFSVGNVTVEDSDFSNVFFTFYVAEAQNFSFDANRIVAKYPSMAQAEGVASLAIRGNTFENASLEFSAERLALTGNQFVNTSFAPTSPSGNYDAFDLSNNTLNGNPVDAFTNRPNFILANEDVGFLLLVNCTNARLEGLRVGASGSIKVLGGSGLIVTSTTFAPTAFGISLASANNSTLDGIAFQGPGAGRVSIEDANGVLVRNSEFQAGEYSGLSVSGSRDLTIENSHFPLGAGLHLSGSENVTFRANQVDWEGPYGLYISSVSNLSILDSEFRLEEIGIFLEVAHNVTFSGNRIDSLNRTGLTISFSDAIRVANNTIRGDWNALETHVSQVVIEDNDMESNKSAAGTVRNGSNVVFTRNVFEGNSSGLSVAGESTVRLEANRFISGGLDPRFDERSDWPRIELGENNTVAGSPIHLFVNCDHAMVDGKRVGQFLAFNCNSARLANVPSGVGGPYVRIHNVSEVTVANVSINALGLPGLQIDESNSVVLESVQLEGRARVLADLGFNGNVSLSDVRFSVSEDATGLSVDYGDSVTISRTLFRGPGRIGSSLSGLGNVSISNSSFEMLEVGLHTVYGRASVSGSIFSHCNVSLQIYWSQNSTISRNRFHGGGTGVDAFASTHLNVSDNVFHEMGTVLEQGYGGTYFFRNQESNTSGPTMALDHAWVRAFGNNFWSGNSFTLGNNTSVMWHWGPFSGGNYWPAHSGPDQCRDILQSSCNRSDGLIDEKYEVALNDSDWFPLLIPAQDSDGDGLPDRWERENGFDPNMPDAWLDVDGDGLTNELEFFAGSDPRLADTNYDNIPDSQQTCPWCLSDVDPWPILLPLVLASGLVLFVGLTGYALWQQRVRPSEADAGAVPEKHEPPTAAVPRVVEEAPPRGPDQ